MLKAYNLSPEGKHVVVAGRSNIVGKPVANILLQKEAFANATVTVCHTGTPDLGAFTRQADFIIAAMPRAFAQDAAAGYPSRPLHLIVRARVRRGTLRVTVRDDRDPVACSAAGD